MAQVKKRRDSIHNRVCWQADYWRRLFISDEEVRDGYCLGRAAATSLSGFIAGAIVACLLWIVAFNAFFIN